MHFLVAAPMQSLFKILLIIELISSTGCCEETSQFEYTDFLKRILLHQRSYMSAIALLSSLILNKPD